MRACSFLRIRSCSSLVQSHVLRKCIMVSYCVYLVLARTLLGTLRIYVGCTCALDIRSYFHTLPERPCWLRACDPKDVLKGLVRMLARRNGRANGEMGKQTDGQARAQSTCVVAWAQGSLEADPFEFFFQQIKKKVRNCKSKRTLRTESLSQTYLQRLWR